MTNYTAQIISIISYPYLIIPISVFFILLRRADSVYYSIFGTLITILVMTIIFTFELVGLKLGMFSNFDITKRKQRASFYMFVLLLICAGVITTIVLKISSELTAIGIGVFIGVSLMFLLNKKVKASIHVATISALLLTVAVLYGNYFYSLLLLIPLIAWSRVKTKKHRVSETIAGAIMGVTIAVLSYTMLQYIA